MAEVRAENQDEIEKIMNEIEGLQKELNIASTPQAPKEEAEVNYRPLEESLSEIEPEHPSHQGGVFGADFETGADAGADSSDSKTEIPFSDRTVPLSSASPVAISTEEGSVSMTMGGKMRLNVKYETSGKDFTLRFTEETIQVILSDGTEFQILIPHKNSKTSSKKAA